MPKISKYIVNPEWEAQRHEWLKENYRHGWDYPYEDRWPEAAGKKLPDDGAWIMLLMEVRVGKQIGEETVKHITVPRLSIWFAVPNIVQRSNLYQAVIQTPEGAVHVWPHEYKICEIEKFLEFTEEDGFQIHFLSQTGGFDEEALFYLRSRGIFKGQAQRMLLPLLKDPNYCYFTFADELVNVFSEGTGTPYLMPHNLERRAAAHARRGAK